MSLQYVTDAGTLDIPGAYPTIAVQSSNSGLATSGVVAIVGEADAGPDFSLESDLSLNLFGPDQVALVQAKYQSGAIVDAMKALAAPANDAQITGAPAGVLVIKVNPSTKASAALSKVGGGTYSTLFDKSYGTNGNLISFTNAVTAEVVPTTGTFTFIPPAGSANMEVRVNGGAALASTNIGAATTPAAFVTNMAPLAASLAVTGGANRAMLGSVHGTVAITAVGNQITLVLTGIANWDTTPTVGDTLYIPATSIFGSAGGGGGTGAVAAGGANVGAYVITAASAAGLVATKLSDAGKAGAVPGTITAPVSVAATAVAATSDLQAFAPITMAVAAGSAVDGLGKSLLVSQLTTGTDLIERVFMQLGTTNAATWVAKAADASIATEVLTSATETAASLAVLRSSDGVSETIAAGGNVALLIGYAGTSAQVVISGSASAADPNSPTQIVGTVVGGTGAGFTLLFKDLPTLSDLARKIGSLTGWTCKVATAVQGSLPSSALDQGTFTCGATFSGQVPGRIKRDAYDFYKEVTNGSVLLQMGTSSTVKTRAQAGVPAAVAATTYLANGARGATTDTVINSALTALSKVRCNFVVPLFSQDASADILEGITDSSSTYTIDSINANTLSHVLTMSTLKKRRNRQAFLSKRGSFSADKTAAANIASFRASMAFEDVKNVAADGSIKQFQPWMASVLAAGMQAAGFYRAIFNKGINCQGALQAAGDWIDTDDSAVADALKNGLLTIARAESGGFRFKSDNTTYAKDGNFVYNSIQAVYCADIVALTMATRMEDAFVGQSLADVSAPAALSFIDGIMADFLRLKLIAVSDDAPRGYKNVVVKISGPAMVVSLEVKLATSIYFIPISFLVSQVQQTARS
jgi:hypothetical protein